MTGKTTIPIAAETKKRLIRTLVVLEAKIGKRLTFDELINILVQRLEG